jgi:hypothetical protein
MAVPTRTSSDVNASADINDLQTQIDGLGSGTPDPQSWQINSWNTPTTDSAELERVVFTNGFEWVAWYDSTTVEYMTKNTKAPSNLDNTGNLTIEIIVLNKVTTSSNVVEYSLEYSARADGETMNNSFTALDSGDKAVNDQTVVSADDYEINRITWTGAISGIAKNDNLRLRLKRITPTGSNVAGDSGVVFIALDWPRE